MENHQLNFKNKRERNDFLIALIVIGFFAWIFMQFGFKRSNDQLTDYVPPVTSGIFTAPSDKDKDGIADDKDACPELAGRAENNGCPLDTDGDGVYDTDDRCPKRAGLVRDKGCPLDSDGDGFYDADDLCPRLAGRDQGCPPDADGDGIPNEDDKCPLKKGPIENNGCPPDADADGISDAKDKCPQLAGTKENNGCPPDSDGDGVYDAEDKCPNLAGLAKDNGCPPDRDGDGVYDADDKCPNLKGVKANKGCPADADGDGIYDANDKCPNKAGTKANKGCPEIKIEAADKAILDKALKSVNFLPNQATLTQYSQGLLNEVVGLLKKYPDYKLAIIGHTDAQGNDAANLQLSKDRANSCLRYIADKGIDAKRLSSNGYGESKPIADNKTPAGRKANRRVEFNLSY